MVSHGHTRGGPSPEYRAYTAAKSRCQNPNVNNYFRYGGRGVEFRFKNFEEFFAHIGPRPSTDHSLDRKNNSGHYEIGNVKWSTRREQCLNRRSGIKLIAQQTSKTGIAGVCWSPVKNKWRAYFTVKGKQTHVGYFDTTEKAGEARKTAVANSGHPLAVSHQLTQAA